MNPTESLTEILITAMRDALRQNKTRELETQIYLDGKALGVVRVIIVPKKMDFKFSTYAPLGTETKEN